MYIIYTSLKRKVALLTKHPIQVYLEARQERALRWLANREKTTLSDLIRRGVDLVLNQAPETDDPVLSIIALGDSGLPNLGVDHDRYLIEKIENQKSS